MDKREQLKSMLNNLINDNQEQAALDLHGYLNVKMQDVAGLSKPDDTVQVEDDIQTE